MQGTIPDNPNCLTTSSITWRRHHEHHVYSPAKCINRNTEPSLKGFKGKYIFKAPALERAVLSCFKLFVLCLISPSSQPAPTLILSSICPSFPCSWCHLFCFYFFFHWSSCHCSITNCFPQCFSPPSQAVPETSIFSPLCMFWSYRQEIVERTRQGRFWVYPLVLWKAQ